MRQFYYFIILAIIGTLSLKGQNFQNILANQDGDKIKITYDLLDERENRLYNIMVQVSDDSGSTYLIYPKNLSGDRSNVRPGNNKKIIWDISKEYFELIGDKYIVKLIGTEAGDVQTQKGNISSGISPWLWIGGGVAVVGGGAAAILLGGKKKESNEIPDLPGPDKISWPK